MESGSCVQHEIDNPLFILLILFLFADLLLASMITAFRIARKFYLFDNSGEGDKGNKSLVAQFLNNANLIATLRIALQFFRIPIVIFGTSLFQNSKCEPLNWWQALLFSIGACFALFLLETLTSAFISRNAKFWSEKTSDLGRIILQIFAPLHQFESKLIGEPKAHEPNMEEVENHLRDWVENIPQNTLLEKEERKMIRSIVHFSNTLIREIMIPRVEMSALDMDSTLEDAASLVLSSGHSRLPVYDDEIDNIIGVLYAKDLLSVHVQKRTVSLRELLRPAVFVPEAKKAGDLLSEMQSSGIHMVVVVDEYGGTSGIVSMEDIVEEIVGEIRDEYDESEEQLVREIGPDEYSFLGRIDLEDVNEYLDTHIVRESADTLAGFMYSKIGKIPVGDEIIEVENWVFSIEELTGRRIRRIHVSRKEAPIETEKENDNGIVE